MNKDYFIGCLTIIKLIIINIYIGILIMIIDSFDNSKPIIEPCMFYGEQKHIIKICLIIFSSSIFDYILKTFKCEVIGEVRSCNGTTYIYAFIHNDKKIGFYLSPIGAAVCATYVIEVNWATGAEKFIMFGSAGSLDKKKTIGKYIIPCSAYRDEGISYHYMKPSNYVDIKNYKKVAKVFDDLNIPYVISKTWTTDAFFHETINSLKKRKAEGCLTVEMEVAGVQAVCNYYGLELYNFLQTGDVLSIDNYEFNKLHDANHDLDKFYIALKLAEKI